MKQITNAVSTIQMGRMIRAAERKKISPTLIFRLIKLYLGTDTHSLMSEWGVYMQCNFNQLSVLLKIHTASELVRAVIDSGWFILGKVPQGESSHYAINWFASPLFLDEGELMAELNKGNQPAEPVEKLTYSIMMGDLFGTANLHCKNAVVNCIINYTGINNIILSGRTISQSTGALESAEKNQVRRLPEAVREQIVDGFIEELRNSKAHRALLLGFISNLTSPTHEGVRKKSRVYSLEEAKEILRLYMYHQVKPYFIDSERFFKTDSFFSRVCWFRNLSVSKAGKQMLADAIKDFKAASARRKHKEQQEAVKNQRSHRPISEHEWMQDGLRYYQDSDEGLVQLPADAPPRPSDKAHWNKFTQKWF